VDDCRVYEAAGEKVRFRTAILPPWADVLRGLTVPVLAVGDGALESWRAPGQNQTSGLQLFPVSHRKARTSMGRS